MDDAVAAVQATYPDAARVPDLEWLFYGSSVFHDLASHTVCVVLPFGGTDDRAEGDVTTLAAHEVATAPIFTSNFKSAPGYWDEKNALMRKIAVALERIYSAAVSERGWNGDGPTKWPDVDVSGALEHDIERARQQLFLLEAMRVRFYRRLIAEAGSPEAAQQALAGFIHDDAWREMQIEDFKRFGPER